MRTSPAESADPPAETHRHTVPRIFLRDPSWRFGLKLGSERVFCHMAAPGQDYYHRISSGELYVEGNDERLCIPCAARRGILAFAPNLLRDPITPIQRPGDEDAEYPLADPDPTESTPTTPEDDDWWKSEFRIDR